MGLPPVVVGMAVYLALSRSGPLGSWGLLFTPQAMLIAQMILVAPIVAALTRQTIEDLWTEYRDELTAMRIGPAGRVATLIFDARFSLVTALLAGFGRAVAEVGAVLIVGGNIDGFTRTMTTAITLETSKGDTALIGPNGAGKTTLLRLIMGLIQPTRGRVTWGDREQAASTHRAIVFQRPTMLRRSAAGNIRYALAAAGGRARDALPTPSSSARSSALSGSNASQRAGSPAASNSGLRSRRRAAGLTVVVSVATRARGGEHHADPP